MTISIINILYIKKNHKQKIKIYFILFTCFVNFIIFRIYSYFV